MTNWIIGGIVIIAIAVGGYFFLGTDNNVMMEGDSMQKDEIVKGDDAMKEKSGDTMMKGEDAMTEKKEDTIMKDEGAMMQKGSYEAYAPDKLAKAASGKVVLFFRATWCPTCKVLDADICSHLGNIPADVTILDVDYDTYTALKQKYGVTYQHTLVQVDASGNQITKWSGGQTLASLLTNVR